MKCSYAGWAATHPSVVLKVFVGALHRGRTGSTGGRLYFCEDPNLFIFCYNGTYMEAILYCCRFSDWLVDLSRVKAL